jgi:hypothetical protein
LHGPAGAAGIAIATESPALTALKAQLAYGSVILMRAESQWLQDVEQASLSRNELRRSQAETRRQQEDLTAYLRNYTPHPAEDQKEARRQERLRALNDPPAADIVSGHALNVLLADLTGPGMEGGPAGTGPTLAADLVRHLNLTHGRAGDNLGVLKDGGRLAWPLGLCGEEYRTPRQIWDRIAPEAVAQAAAGRVDAQTLEPLRQALDRMGQQLAADIGAQTPSNYIGARRFLAQLADAFRALSRPEGLHEARDFKGNDVAALVRFMASRRLRFAPAAPGDEAAYRALHRLLVALDADAVPVTARAK